MGEQADALLERFVGSLIGSAEMVNVYLGDRLGLYEPLAKEWLTSKDLAQHAGIAERYAREGLQKQGGPGFSHAGGKNGPGPGPRKMRPARNPGGFLEPAR